MELVLSSNVVDRMYILVPFRDIQLAVLMETARAHLELGDYFVEPAFVSDLERAYAEDLIPKVSGPSFKQIRERQKMNSMNQLPRHQVK